MQDLAQSFAHAPFWIALGQIIWINILLSGDNAVVIALACRTLPSRQRFWGIVLGAGAAFGDADGGGQVEVARGEEAGGVGNV